MKKILIAGPDTMMEFGWLLMRWQAKIRNLAKFYDKVFVSTSPDKYFVYDDFALKLECLGNHYSPNMWRLDGCEIDYVRPDKAFCCSTGDEKFIKYGTPGSYPECIVLHMRNKGDGREWDTNKWYDFTERLRKIVHIPLVAIGDINKSYCVPGVLNKRGVEGYETCNILRNAKLCIGPSSGAMHLASLCGCPHFVWTNKKKWNLGFRKGTNRERYETAWNPLNTPVKIMDIYGWNPAVEIILNEVSKYLRKE